jgi:hypothetical protein
LSFRPYISKRRRYYFEIDNKIELSNGGYVKNSKVPYDWQDINGFSEIEIRKLQDLISSLAHIIFRLARNGGFDNASSF